MRLPSDRCGHTQTRGAPLVRPPTERQRKLYAFFCKQVGKPFVLERLLNATGYGSASAERSLGEHWGGVVERLGTGTPKKWRTTVAFDDMSLEEFHQAISQSKRDPVAGKLRNGHASRLAALAKTQALLAVETLNRSSLDSRVESFLLLFLNAWELLLKAEVVENDDWKAVFQPTKPGKTPRSLRFETLVSQLSGATDAEAALKAQLSDLYKLRNQAAHLLLCSPSREMLHLFAGAVRSFSVRFHAVAGSRPFLSTDVAGYLVLVGITDFSREIQAVPATSEINQRISNNIAQFGDHYAIPLRVRIHAVDDGLAATASLAPGHVLTTSTKAVRDTFRFKRDEVARRVVCALQDRGHDVDVRPHHVDLVRSKEQWGTTAENELVTEFPAAKLYSQAACDRIVKLLEAQPDYLEVAQRQKNKQAAKKRKRTLSQKRGSRK